MRKSRHIILVLAFIGCLPVHAGPIIDGREWYQPADLLGFSWNDFNAVCAGGPCSGMVGGAGPDLSGWTWASALQVGDLLAATTPHPGGIAEYQDPVSSAMVFDFLDLGFNPTIPVQVYIETGATGVGGITSTLAPGPGTAYLAGVDGNLFLAQSRATTQETLPVGADDYFVGAWLFRAAPVGVPAPATLPLLVTVFAVLGWQRRKRIWESHATDEVIL